MIRIQTSSKIEHRSSTLHHLRVQDFGGGRRTPLRFKKLGILPRISCAAYPAIAMLRNGEYRYQQNSIGGHWKKKVLTSFFNFLSMTQRRGGVLSLCFPNMESFRRNSSYKKISRPAFRYIFFLTFHPYITRHILVLFVLSGTFFSKHLHQVQISLINMHYKHLI